MRCKMTFGWAAAIIAAWMTVEAEAIELTTAVGRGADTYINGEGTLYHYGDSNFGALTTMQMRRSGGDYTRKIYVRFDTLGIHANDVTLRFTVSSIINQSVADTTVNVWGLNDGVLGTDNSSPPNGSYLDDEDIHDEFWPELVIDWFSAPGNLGDTTVDSTKTSLLGTFLVPQVSPTGTVVTFNHPNLLSMIQNDTNGLITLILQPSVGTDYINFYTKEHGTAAYSPTLVFPTAVCTWDGQGGADKNWSQATNWDTDGLPLDAATFTNFATATAGTVTSVVDEGFTVGTLTFE
ncbi:MAG: hypothetical protein U1E05_22855, partial [Patescibacteria group bacterium]|nr:hypothetical protein [Patescibacteria group bacterium]